MCTRSLLPGRLLSLLHICLNSYLSFKDPLSCDLLWGTFHDHCSPKPPALCSSAHCASITRLGCNGLKMGRSPPLARCSRRPCSLCSPALSPGPGVGQVPNSIYQVLLSQPWPSSHPACLTTSCLSFKPQLRLHFRWELLLTSQSQEEVLLCLSFLHGTLSQCYWLLWSVSPTPLSSVRARLSCDSSEYHRGGPRRQSQYPEMLVGPREECTRHE